MDCLTRRLVVSSGAALQFFVDGSIVLLCNSNGEVQLIAEPTQRAVAAAMLDSEEPADLQQALELQSRRLVGLQLLDVQKHHPHRALSTGNPIPSPTHSPSIFYQTFLIPLLHNSSTEPLREISHCQIKLKLFDLIT
ncbi:hypothetical protein WN944_024357 [Citrus x changshan-huyou]|uniref:Uncharacterized protein n=1 Tax=Citrus x changshan-huyou TaxID=2935761 RepID=A0AAP0QCJ5_9ROSI